MLNAEMYPNHYVKVFKSIDDQKPWKYLGGENVRWRFDKLITLEMTIRKWPPWDTTSKVERKLNMPNWKTKCSCIS